MRPRLLALLGTLLALSLPTTLRAQGQDCELLPGAREATRSFIGGEALLRISGPARFVCPGEVVLQADSAVGRPDRDEYELIGNVFYQDSVKTLTAAWARYTRGEARLLARGDVVLTDRKSKSRIAGPELEYLQQNESRAEAEAIIQGRPHATFLREEPAGAEPDSAAQPLEVDADIMRLYGESRFVALGDVVMTRGETRGFGREGEFDHKRNTMLLTGTARLEGDGYTLSGDRIEAALDGERLREVTARRQAALQAEDLDLAAPELRIYFAAGEVERLIAVGEPTASAPDSRPVVISRDLRLVADSIDALAPGQQMERVVAVGAAYAVRTPDSLDVGLPETIAHDWVAGDTITGYFTLKEVPDSVGGAGAPGEPAEPDDPADPGGERRATLERLVAIGEGGGARSLYRIREKGHEAEPPSANYLVANRIVLVLRDGEVKEVEADGPIEGMHLQPAGSAKRDTGTTVSGTAAEPPGGTPETQR